MTKYIAGLLALLVLACGCSKNAAETSAPQTVTVQTALAEAREVQDITQAVGTVQSKNEAVLSSKLTGIVQAVWADAGDRAGKGKILLTIEDADIKARRTEAEEAKAEAQGAISEAEAATDEAHAARENADADLVRMKNLFVQGAVTKKEYEGALMQSKVMAAKVGQAEARKKQAKARTAQAEAAILQADINMGYTIIRAPFSGVVTEKSASKGELASPGRPLMKMVDDNTLRLSATVKEGGLGGIMLGMPVSVRIDALGRDLEGQVEEIIPAADSMTRSFEVRITLPKAEGLMPGMFGRAKLPSGKRKMIGIPRDALVEKEGMQGVYTVARDGIIRFQLVRAGGEAEGMREVLSGLSGGETVIVGDKSQVREGMKAAL
ncbi:MAG TPA: efflux RND transporter periplasmic adaptor subunit [Nitrospirota bacterium]|jgi:multidrug efflux pump subunit AcrA (membrane-fusion protein)